jgi:hypothetical protein
MSFFSWLSTLFRNVNSGSYGGGIDIRGGTVTLTDCTLSQNSASAGGGIYNPFPQNGPGGTLNLINTIVAENFQIPSGSGSPTYPDVFGPVSCGSIRLAKRPTLGPSSFELESFHR